MISHKHKFIFIHAPKTAGNSIQNHLQHYSEDVIIMNKGQKIYNKRNETHLDRFDLKSSDKKIKINKHTTLNAYYNTWRKKYGCIEDFFKFGTVRNPWDRAISNYFFKGTDHCRAAGASQKYKSFNKKRFINSLRKCSCTDFFYVKKYDRYKLDYIIRFETLQQDFNTVCDQIGIPQQQLPHANESKHKHYTEYYDEETRSIVAERYAKDIECFGYKFGE